MKFNQLLASDKKRTLRLVLVRLADEDALRESDRKASQLARPTPGRNSSSSCVINFWFCVLDLRGKIKRNVRKVLGNGKNTNVWYDQWSSVGTLSDMVNNRDYMMQGSKMAVKRKLQTQDRMMAWNNNNDMKCPLCKKVNDSHNHLLFECDFSRIIWEDLKVKMEEKSLSNNWDALINQYAGSVCNNSIRSILKRIVFATAVYNIWKERNNRLFAGKVKDDKIVLKIISENVKLQLLGLKVKKTSNVERIASNWDIKLNYKS
ncbi:RNA-directed DNA polymerase, eukaryota, reverse transcriptase zinc-binding domain protein [Tanacetum coccineum]|uniref:RNA-directed DNA polymerase, eukaryota, reverse transcriptase zinc-binding domain protein n=1 Tax=Tanacetum coccineum TaxID=301880 RepID=A0ABQ5DJT8_9ASTR